MVRRALLIPLCLASASASAGGHFDVDDAGTLDPGRCQYELWGVRYRGPDASQSASLWHLGPACRVGPVELGLNIERSVVQGTVRQLLGPQLKWTFYGQAADAPLSAAVSATVNVNVPRDGTRVGGQFVLPVSWHALPSLYVHGNLGVDWATDGGQRTKRGGAQLEWALNDKWSFIAERNRAFDLWTSRVGTRYSFTQFVTLDVSFSQTGPQKVRGLIVGLNHEFGR